MTEHAGGRVDHPAGSSLRHTGFHVEIAAGDGATLLRLSGELDMATAPRLREALSSVLDARPSSIAVDVADLTFVDSTGVGVFLSASRRAATIECPFVVRFPRRAVLRVLRLTGVERLMVIEPYPSTD